MERIPLRTVKATSSKPEKQLFTCRVLYASGDVLDVKNDEPFKEQNGYKLRFLESNDSNDEVVFRMTHLPGKKGGLGSFVPFSSDDILSPDEKYFYMSANLPIGKDAKKRLERAKVEDGKPAPSPKEGQDDPVAWGLQIFAMTEIDGVETVLGTNGAKNIASELSLCRSEDKPVPSIFNIHIRPAYLFTGGDSFSLKWDCQAFWRSYAEKGGTSVPFQTAQFETGLAKTAEKDEPIATTTLKSKGASSTGTPPVQEGTTLYEGDAE
jgi:hypothetical protein